MKRSYLACLLLFILTACNEKQDNTTLVKGEIRGLGNDTLYIYGADKMYDRIDTIPVSNDKFTVTLSPDTLVSTWLWFGDGTRYPLFMDRGEKIEIKGTISPQERNKEKKESESESEKGDGEGNERKNTNRPLLLEVSGNAFNEELTTFLKTLYATADCSDEEQVEQAARFIDANPASLTSIYLLDHYFVQASQPDYKRIKSLTDHLTGGIKDRPYIADLLERLQEEEKAGIGKTLSQFQLPNASGKRISRSDFKQQYILIHFWASWDTLSRADNAIYRRIYRKEKKNKQFALLGVSLDIDKTQWQEAIRKDTLEWEQACALSGWETELVKQLAIRTLPANVLLSPSGRIEGKDLTEEALEEKLDKNSH